MFIHAAEGTFMVHSLAITYARWFSPPSVHASGNLKRLEEGLAINVCKDLDWLDRELDGRRFLAGEQVTAADTMCLFSVQFIFERGLCGGGRWGSGGILRGGLKLVRGRRVGRGRLRRRDIRCDFVEDLICLDVCKLHECLDGERLDGI
jgi:glutathione S-transferase